MALMTDAPSDPLAEIRREIDRIDEAMHLLLMERGAVIDRLVAAKRVGETVSAFRPAREADMMRRIARRHTGRLPLATAEHLWRTIIATFTHVQAPFTLHVEQGADALAMHDLARFHVGFDVPLAGHGTPSRVVEAVSRSAGDLGLVRLDPTPATAWWDGLAEAGLEVTARLPFFGGESHPVGSPALLLARPPGDAGAGDVSVWSVADEGEIELPEGAETLSSVTRNARRSRLVAFRGDAAPAESATALGRYAAPEGA